jgi:hypothetical protein
VRSRSLDGGPPRAEAVVPGLSPERLDAGRGVLAVGGGLPDEEDGNLFATGISVTRPGSGRAELGAVRRFSQAFAVINDPAIGADGMSWLTYDPLPGAATGLAGSVGSQATGMPVLEWDRSGSAAVFLVGATGVGCAVGRPALDPVDIVELGAAPCRIVVVPDLGGERLLPPELVVQSDVAFLDRAVRRRGKFVRTAPLVGVVVQVLGEDGTPTFTGRTGAKGTVELPPRTDDRVVVALTPSPTYALDADGPEF